MNGIVVAHIHGIAVKVNPGVAIVAAAVVWTLAHDILPTSATGYGVADYWLWATIVSLLFFVGLLAHEFGHALVAQRYKVRVSSITLWVFGGVASLDSPIPSARSALHIAIAGPAVSLGLGAGSVIIGALSDGLTRAALLWLGLITVALALFNLIPAFPMDGGRVYQAIVWQRTGSETRATMSAARLGRSLARLFILGGVAQMVVFGMFGGIWFVVIGWFISGSAAAEVDALKGRERPTDRSAI